MKTDLYKIENSIEKINNKKSTLFLDQKEFNEVTKRLKKNSYKVYYPYKDSEKVIIYYDTEPNVVLFKIKSFNKLRHQDILGSIMALNISSSYLGDIIVLDDSYYFYVLNELSDFIKENLNTIGNNSVTLEKIDIDFLKDYERKYEKFEIIVSSLRIDNVLSKIIGTNREKILEKIRNKEVILNCEILTKISTNLKENDTFSVRKFGKYKFVGVVNHTKKDNLVINYLKYL